MNVLVMFTLSFVVTPAINMLIYFIIHVLILLSRVSSSVLQARLKHWGVPVMSRQQPNCLHQADLQQKLTKPK